MKLYYTGISDNCRAVLATLTENGRTDVELIDVDLMKGEHKSPEFLALNPNGKVPVLVDGNLNLWESTAIMQYLSSDSPLWPKSNVRYDIIRWQSWGLSHWGPAIGKIVGERLLAPMFGNTPDPAKITEGLGHFERFAKVLDGHLEGRDWLVGEEISLADLAIAGRLTYAKPAQIDLTPYTHIARWYASIEARESWRKSAPPMG